MLVSSYTYHFHQKYWCRSISGILAEGCTVQRLYQSFSSGFYFLVLFLYFLLILVWCTANVKTVLVSVPLFHLYMVLNLWVCGYLPVVQYNGGRRNIIPSRTRGFLRYIPTFLTVYYEVLIDRLIGNCLGGDILTYLSCVSEGFHPDGIDILLDIGKFQCLLFYGVHILTFFMLHVCMEYRQTPSSTLVLSVVLIGRRRFFWSIILDASRFFRPMFPK